MHVTARDAATGFGVEPVASAHPADPPAFRRAESPAAPGRPAPPLSRFLILELTSAPGMDACTVVAAKSDGVWRERRPGTGRALAGGPAAGADSAMPWLRVQVYPPIVAVGVRGASPIESSCPHIVATYSETWIPGLADPRMIDSRTARPQVAAQWVRTADHGPFKDRS